MRKLYLLFCLFLLAVSGKSWAQNKSGPEADFVFYRNSVYAELGGNGVVGSINYERLIYLPTADATMAMRAGGIFIPEGLDGGKLKYEMIIPVEVSFIRGKKPV